MRRTNYFIFLFFLLIISLCFAVVQMHPILATAQNDLQINFSYDSNYDWLVEGKKTTLVFDLVPANFTKKDIVDINQPIYINYAIISPSGEIVKEDFLEINYKLKETLPIKIDYQFDEPGIWKILYLPEYISDLKQNFINEESLQKFYETKASYTTLHVLSISELSSIQQSNTVIEGGWLNTLTTFAQIAMVLLTFLMVIVSAFNIQQSKKQLELFLNQTLVMKNQKAPLLRVENKSFKNNKLIVKIKNFGAGVAIDLGVDSTFTLGEFIPTSKTPNGFVGSFSYDSTLLVDERENKKIYGNGCVSFILETKGNPLYLGPNESKEVTIEPCFFVKYGKTPLAGGRKASLDELIKIVKSAKKTFIGLSFDLIYKDINEDVQNEVLISKFTFNVFKHQNLEEASKDNLDFSYTALGHDEILKKMKWLPSYTYKGMKTMKNSPSLSEKNNFFDE